VLPTVTVLHTNSYQGPGLLIARTPGPQLPNKLLFPDRGTETLWLTEYVRTLQNGKIHPAGVVHSARYHFQRTKFNGKHDPKHK
jgi:hypothetical protein